MIAARACDCGGRLRRAAIPDLPIEPLFGLKGRFEGSVRGFRCEACGSETFDGSTIERMLLTVARSVVAQPRILSEDEARFVRKALLGLTQDALAERMGINKITVADWERGERPLSKEHDYELRGIALASLIARLPPSLLRKVEEFPRVFGEILRAPRLAGPPRRSKRYLIPTSKLVPG